MRPSVSGVAPTIIWVVCPAGTTEPFCRSPLFCARYKLEKEKLEGLGNYEIMEAVGRKRGFLISGGEINTERTALMLLDEFRGCKIGRISLERPE